METTSSRKWSELLNLPVYVPKLGKSLGTVVDFFFKEGSNSIYALRVLTCVNGDFALPACGIKAVEIDKVTIDNENMLIKALPPLPQSKDLIGMPVVSENDEALGEVSEVSIALNPLDAMRLSALGIFTNGGKAVGFTADSIVSFTNERVVIDNHIARKLK
ncbi:PRC-barrel domain-containing protein [Ktedonobacter racemifer]|uniref:PRC-barrel domain-containing protein n=1 Tax=Ktedonobacter racemifer DSM 44963 TaxID=485913 RepID=D6TS41_KTERA|nr:PRC-barrel domain-containing protein [Ktedonobacter racemifer]EFH86114.1 hypothetical protein Krac_7389 [Ktedonobacter racemifer DSM 44963]